MGPSARSSELCLSSCPQLFALSYAKAMSRISIALFAQCLTTRSLT